MFDFGLKPCPLCGGEAEVAMLMQSPEQQKAVIKCTDCGLTLDWETEIKVGISRSGARQVMKCGPDPIQAWNRRANDCECCAFKSELERITKLPNCNDCAAQKTCEHMPRIGATARINCPLWQGEENAK